MSYWAHEDWLDLMVTHGRHVFLLRREKKILCVSLGVINDNKQLNALVGRLETKIFAKCIPSATQLSGEADDVFGNASLRFVRCLGYQP